MAEFSVYDSQKYNLLVESVKLENDLIPLQPKNVFDLCERGVLSAWLSVEMTSRTAKSLDVYF